MLRTTVTLGCLWTLAFYVAPARADRVHLKEGSVIEGKAERRGDKVVIQLESGEVSLPARDVVKIESAVSPLERLAQLEVEQRGNGVPGLLALADFCREHDLRARERALLEQVIALEPEHAIARARLGHERDERGWVTQDAVRREQARRDDEARAQRLAQEKAALELEAQRVALEREKLTLEQQRSAAAKASSTPADATEPAVSSPPIVYTGAFGHGHPGWHRGGPEACHHARCERPLPARREPFPIAGVRDPRDPSWRIPGVKDPLEKRRPRARASTR